MAYIISSAPDVYIATLDRHARTARNEAVSVRAASTGTFNRNRLLNLRDLLDRLLLQITDILALPSYMQLLIRDRIRENLDDATYDAAAELTAMQTEAQSLVAWIEANYPVHTDGGQSTYDIDGNPLTFTLTAGQITALQNAIDSFTSTITLG